MWGTGDLMGEMARLRRIEESQMAEGASRSVSGKKKEKGK